MTGFDKKLLQSNITSDTVSTTKLPSIPTTPKTEGKPQIKQLFPGITPEQIGDNLELLNEYKKANTDGKAGISIEEYSVYIKNSDSPFAPYRLDFENKVKAEMEQNSSLSREKAVGKVTQKMTEEHMQKANDKLKQFGYDPNTVDMSKVNSLNQKEVNTVLVTLQAMPQVHEGMTRAEARKKGGKIWQDFQAVCPEGKDRIDESDILNYKIKELANQGITVERIVKTVQTSSKENRMQLDMALINMVADPSLIKEEFKDIKSVPELLNTLCITKEEWNSLSTTEQGQLLGKKIREMLKNDLSMQDDNSFLADEIRRLKAGKFNESEKKQGYQDGDQITDDKELLKMAMKSVMQSYMSTISHLTKQISANGNDEDKRAIVESLFESLKEAPQFRQLLEAFGIDNIEDNNIKQEVISAVLENEKESTDLTTLAGTSFGTTIISNADDDNIQTFFKNNSDQIDILKDISKDVINSMPEGERKTSLQNSVNKAIEAYSSTDSAQSKPTPNKTSESVVTNPIPQYNKPTETQRVTDISNQSKEFYKTKLAPKTTQLSASEIHKQQLEAIESEMHSKMKIKMQGLKNKTLGGAMSEIYSHYNEMPDAIKLKFRSHMQAMPINHLCEAYIQGDNNLRNFMVKMQFVNQNALNKYFDSNHAELKKAPLTIQREYYVSKNEEMQKEFDKKKSLVIDTESMDYSDNWHVL